MAIGADAKLGIVALLAAVVIEMLVFFVAHAYVDVVGGEVRPSGVPIRRAPRPRHPARRDPAARRDPGHRRLRPGTSGRGGRGRQRDRSAGGSDPPPRHHRLRRRPARSGPPGRAVLEGLVVALIGVAILLLKLLL